MNRDKYTDKRNNYGYTFVEILVAITLFAIVTVAFLPWFQQSGKMGKLMAQEVTAKNIAQGLLEKMLADRYENVTTANYPESGVTYYIDQIIGIVANVTITIEGDGMVSSAAAQTLTDDTASWETNEWTGSNVFIIDGTGRGQRAFIKSNTNQTLEITLDMSGMTDIPWDIIPDTTSHYLINGGKTVTITVDWQYQGQSYAKRLIGLVPFYASGV